CPTNIVNTEMDIAIDVDDKSSKKSELGFYEADNDETIFDKSKVQTHTFTSFPEGAEYELQDEEDETEGDKSQLLQDGKTSPSFWTFEYYKQFFDVDTNQLLYRIAGSMTPRPNSKYLKGYIRPNPDLYGPFWICCTLVFTTAITGNLANYLQTAGKDYKWKYDFHKVTYAAAAIFGYWWVLPTAIFGLLWWRKSQTGITFLEILCVYGYSLAIYIPISILWVINVTWLRWILVVVAAVLSGLVLVQTFWPAVSEDNRKVAIAVVALIFIFHALLAAGFLLYFFHSPAPVTTAAPFVPVSPVTTIQNVSPEHTNSTLLPTP
ncbi:hypothetical protein ACJMK2_042268, partial [Sinanodonta woodiana]